MTRLLFVLAAALAMAPVALADGPMPYSSQQGTGVLSADGALRYTAVGAVFGGSTIIEAISTHDGTIRQYDNLPGSYGVPLGADGNGDGISPDGKTLILGDVSYSYPRTKSAFAVVALPSLRVRQVFALHGDFAFDALSPDGSRLYLIQHVDRQDQTRYVVRAYDIPSLTLLPGRIADRTQKSWVMKGSPVTRTVSADGRYVYTLYSNPGGFPFVHALDTVRGVARCVGLPWHGAESGVYNMRLALHGGKLRVHFVSGRPWLSVDTTTWRLSADRGGRFAWWWLTVALVAAVALAAAGYHRLRHGRRTGAFTPRTA
jgi:hypothetical protein